MGVTNIICVYWSLIFCLFFLAVYLKKYYILANTTFDTKLNSSLFI